MGAALSLDHLVTLLNINAAPCEISISSTGENHLSWADVYGALGKGNLSRDAYVIGLAMYTQDSAMISEALNRLSVAVAELFEREGWSSTSPFKQRVNELVRNNKLPSELAQSEKEQRGKQLIVRMARLALNELLTPGVCNSCDGNGYIDGRLHLQCSGTGRKRISGAERARYCSIEKDAWKKTWQWRYEAVNQIAHNWQMDFETHLVKRCRSIS